MREGSKFTYSYFHIYDFGFRKKKTTENAEICKIWGVANDVDETSILFFYRQSIVCRTKLNRESERPEKNRAVVEKNEENAHTVIECLA